jgi:hypothetical protein
MQQSHFIRCHPLILRGRDEVAAGMCLKFKLCCRKNNVEKMELKMMNASMR